MVHSSAEDSAIDQRPSIDTLSPGLIDRVTLSGSASFRRCRDRAHAGCPRPEGTGSPPPGCGRPGSRRRYLLMGTSMTVDPGSTDDLPRRAGAGEPHALAAPYARY